MLMTTISYRAITRVIVFDIMLHMRNPKLAIFFVSLLERLSRENMFSHVVRPGNAHDKFEHI